MSKSLATESSAGAPKKHFIEKLIAAMAVLLLTLGLTSTAAPAFAAATLGIRVTITPTEGTGSGTITAQSINSASAQLLVKVDGTQINVLNTVSGGTGSWANPTTTVPLPYDGLTAGQTLTVEYPYVDSSTGQSATLVIATYVQPALPDPISSVFAEAPVSNGTQVTIPVVTGYKYVDVTGATLSGVVPIPVGGNLEVSAVSTSPTVVLEGTTTWMFGYVAPAPVLALPPQQRPVANDVDGIANDTITVYAGGECWGNPMLNGVSYAPGTYAVAGIVDGKGNITVTYPLLPNCALRGGGTSYSFPALHFSEVVFTPVPTPTPTEPTPPADTTETTMVEICHATGQGDEFVAMTVSAASLEREGHFTHQDGQDKIKAFTTIKQGEEYSFPGRNWDQASFDNGCKTAIETPAPTPTETAVPTPTETAVPAPTPSASVTPAPTQSTTGTTVTTSETGTTVHEQGSTTQRDFVVETAAAGQVPLTVMIGRVLIAAGILLLVVSVALSVKRRRIAE